jgi:hypothetical protein
VKHRHAFDGSGGLEPRNRHTKRPRSRIAS